MLNKNRFFDSIWLLMSFISISMMVEASVVLPEPLGLSWVWVQSRGSLGPRQESHKWVKRLQHHHQPGCPPQALRIRQVSYWAVNFFKELSHPYHFKIDFFTVNIHSLFYWATASKCFWVIWKIFFIWDHILSICIACFNSFKLKRALTYFGLLYVL